MSYPLPSIIKRAHLAPRLMMNMYDRIGSKDPAAKRLVRLAWDDAGYCLDAPEELPAGSTERYEVGLEPDAWVPSATQIDRGGDSHE